MRSSFAAAAFCLALAPHATAQGNVSLTITEEALNRLVARLGVPSDSGRFRPRRSEANENMICHSIGFVECPGRLPPGTPEGFSGHRIPLELCQSLGSPILLPAPSTVSWSWWVTDARFQIKPGSMTFTATVRSQVGSEIRTRTRTVAAWVAFDPAADRLRLEVGDFSAPVEYERNGTIQPIRNVAVDELFTLAVPLEARTFSVPALVGGELDVRGDVQSVPSVVYSLGSLRVAFDLSFSRE